MNELGAAVAQPAQDHARQAGLVEAAIESADGEPGAHRAPAFVDQALEAFLRPGGDAEGGEFV